MLVEFELIEKARAGDDAAFNRIIQSYRKRILGTIARLIGRLFVVTGFGAERVCEIRQTRIGNGIGVRACGQIFRRLRHIAIREPVAKRFDAALERKNTLRK